MLEKYDLRGLLQGGAWEAKRQSGPPMGRKKEGQEEKRGISDA